MKMNFSFYLSFLILFLAASLNLLIYSHSLIWAPTGIAAAMLIQHKVKYTPLLGFAVLLAGLLYLEGFKFGFLISLSFLGELLLFYMLVLNNRSHFTLQKASDYLKLFLFSIIIPSFSSVPLEGYFLPLLKTGYVNVSWGLLLQVHLSHSLGLFLFFTYYFKGQKLIRTLQWPLFLKRDLLLLSATILFVFLFYHLLTTFAYYLPFALLLLPVILLGAFYYGQSGAVSIAGVINVILLLSYASLQSSLSEHDLEGLTFRVQIILLSLHLLAIFIAIFYEKQISVPKIYFESAQHLDFKNNLGPVGIWWQQNETFHLDQNCSHILAVQKPPTTFSQFLELIHPLDRALLSKQFNPPRLFSLNEPIELRLKKTNNGNHTWISFQGSIVQRNKQHYDYFGTIIDITTQNNETDKLHPYFQACESTQDGLLITDNQQRITYTNPSATKALQSTKLTGHNVRDLLASSEKVGQIFSNLEQHKGWVGQVDFEIESKSKVPVALSVACTFTRQGMMTGQVWLFKEITEFKLVEQALIQSKEQAENAIRLKNQFLANMSHEIRTPMNAILGFSELLKGQVVDQRLQGYIASIQSSGKSLLTLINDILDLSKIESERIKLNYEPVNIETFFTKIKEAFTTKAKDKGLQISLKIQDGLPRELYIDEIRLRQIVANLMGNAIKFTQKGKVELLVHYKTTNIANHYLLDIAVRDTGIGVPENAKKEIFKAFQQGDSYHLNQTGGVGLGLTICNRLILIMNGSLSFISKEGVGSTFTAHLQLKSPETFQPALETPLTVDHPELNLRFKPSTILIVDDISLNRILIREYCKSNPITVLEAENGQVACDLLATSKIDVIFMDLKMPILDGYQATEYIREELKLTELPIIALTSSISGHVPYEMKAAGFTQSMHKPLSKPQLFSVLAQFLPLERKDSDFAKKRQTDVEDEKFIWNSLDQKDIYKIELEFKEQISSKFDSIEKGKLFREIKDFGCLLQQFGEKYNIIPLVEVGSKFEAAADSYDADVIEKQISNFKQLRNKLTQTLGKQS